MGCFLLSTALYLLSVFLHTAMLLPLPVNSYAPLCVIAVNKFSSCYRRAPCYCFTCACCLSTLALLLGLYFAVLEVALSAHDVSAKISIDSTINIVIACFIIFLLFIYTNAYLVLKYTMAPFKVITSAFCKAGLCVKTTRV